MPGGDRIRFLEEAHVELGVELMTGSELLAYLAALERLLKYPGSINLALVERLMTRAREFYGPNSMPATLPANEDDELHRPTHNVRQSDV